MRAPSADQIAHRLATLEAGKNQDTLVESSIRVVDKLGTHLVHVIGKVGFLTLLSRAVKLTTSTSASSCTVRTQIPADQSHFFEAPPSETQEALSIVRNIIELLNTFIGEELTMRIVTSVWPDFDIDTTNNKEAT